MAYFQIELYVILSQIDYILGEKNESAKSYTCKGDIIESLFFM